MFRPSGRSYRPPRGFTLIELLVVIAIIALLVSIVMPSLARAKDLAKEAKCLTNQRAVGMAVQFYAGEYGGRLPSSESWIDDILDYLGDTVPDSAFDYTRQTMPPALFCPEDPDPYPRPYMTGKMEYTSYMVNGAETDYAMGSGAKIRLGLFGGRSTLDGARCASTCMMLGETTNYGKVVDLDHAAAQAAFADVGGNASRARTSFHHRATSGFFHHGKMSIYHVDGHSDAVAGKTVSTLPAAQWPSGALMNSATAFYPSLSLPTADDEPDFWGAPYTD